ncbi:DUF393 domain-containing protein [Aureibaculum sp. A20]|uniref:DUF393 domain-containing protein n=1 Tax=Aureibaculum flavum TaxID=2795986 RepID=A0ABS0WSI3_9FLAO|nr:DCC1-like thiol-disulfide oxidoreductase family protein [Aureibaculum flavum]MBJ2174926.1 DUF393 domain-containing protein [Aureibaculum flavum]
MTTLKNYTLLYDDDCPLCKTYTSVFIKTKMLDRNGRQAYSSISQMEYGYIDLEKAKNQIALINHDDKTVLYGIDSLLKVIGYSFPFIEKIGQTSPIKWFLKKLYSFISYNRKVIIPIKKRDFQCMSCEPEFNIKYRIIYILFTTLITSLVLYQYSEQLFFLPDSTIGRETVLAIVQIVFQSVFLLKINRNDLLNYIGNLMTVSLMGSLMLMPIIIINHFIMLPTLILLSWFGLTALLMFMEHYRRVNLLNLSTYLSYTWVLYRVIALLLILNL